MAKGFNYRKTCLKLPLKKNDQKLVFKTDYPQMQVKSIAECSKGSIPQYFRPSLSYQYLVSIVAKGFSYSKTCFKGPLKKTKSWFSRPIIP